MSRSNWLYDFAFRGWLIAGLFLFPLSLAAQQETEQPTATVDDGQGVAIETPSQQDQVDENAGEDKKNPSGALDGGPALNNERPTEPTCDERCPAAEKRQQDDLIAQQSMADSTASMSRATWIQIGLGTVGLILLAITAYYARQAAVAAKEAVIEARKATKITRAAVTEAKKTTKAAVKAATEARRQADIAELSIRNLERPYLFPEIADTDYLRNSKPNKPFLRYRFINHGRTPAILKSVSVRLVSIPKLPLRVPLGVKIDGYEVVASGKFTTDKTIDVEGSNVGDTWRGVEATKLIFHGCISYEDVTGTLHADHFCLRFTKNAKSFVIDGGKTYNYRTSVGPNMEIERPEE